MCHRSSRRWRQPVWPSPWHFPSSSTYGEASRVPRCFLLLDCQAPERTTEARRIEVEQSALRLTKGEWVKALYGLANPLSASDAIEGQLTELGLRALELGLNVVVDFGLWDRDERSALRQEAADPGAGGGVAILQLPPLSSGDDLIDAKPKSRTRQGTCPTRSSPSGLPSSASRRKGSLTAPNLSMRRHRDFLDLGPTSAEFVRPARASPCQRSQQFARAMIAVCVTRCATGVALSGRCDVTRVRWHNSRRGQPSIRE